MKDATKTMSGSGAAVKLRQAALATRHMMDMEKFRSVQGEMIVQLKLNITPLSITIIVSSV
jgi:hypothetical protein